MTEATLAAAAVQILEPVAAQLLEDLHAKWSAEITKLEAEAPARIAAAEQVVQDHIDKLINAIHGHLADLNVGRAGASTAPAQIEQLPEGQSADLAGPAVVGPGPHTGIEMKLGETGTASNEAVPPAKPTATATATSSPAGTAVPADGKTGA